MVIRAISKESVISPFGNKLSRTTKYTPIIKNNSAISINMK
jgi:hypothetical protein